MDLAVFRRNNDETPRLGLELQSMAPTSRNLSGLPTYSWCGRNCRKVSKVSYYPLDSSILLFRASELLRQACCKFIDTTDDRLSKYSVHQWTVFRKDTTTNGTPTIQTGRRRTSHMFDPERAVRIRYGIDRVAAALCGMPVPLFYHMGNLQMPRVFGTAADSITRQTVSVAQS